MAFLFDTNAISEGFRRRPDPELTAWIRNLPRDEQFTSIVVIAELFVAASRSAASNKWLVRIEEEVLPAVTVLDFDLECARLYGRLQAHLMAAGTPIGAIDVQIAATAQRYGLTMVTANARHFERIPDLRLRTFEPGAGR